MTLRNAREWADGARGASDELSSDIPWLLGEFRNAALRRLNGFALPVQLRLSCLQLGSEPRPSYFPVPVIYRTGPLGRDHTATPSATPGNQQRAQCTRHSHDAHGQLRERKRINELLTAVPR